MDWSFIPKIALGILVLLLIGFALAYRRITQKPRPYLRDAAGFSLFFVLSNVALFRLDTFSLLQNFIANILTYAQRGFLDNLNLALLILSIGMSAFISGLILFVIKFFKEIKIKYFQSKETK